MEGDQAQRHRCKVCRKSFPSGRSLGGHMRSHVHTAVIGSSETDAEEKLMPSIRGAGYGLRENPKKTWRLSDFAGDDDEKQCRECGKVFSSWRALFGHMKCHSERICRASEEQEVQQEGSWSNGGQSESEAAAAAVPRRRRGSRSMVAAIAASSSSASEYEKEEEDGAISLMMLSRDVWYSGSGSGGGVLALAESSDKNSAVFEGKGIGEGDGDFVSRNGYWRNGFKRVESDASDDRLVRDSEFKKPKVCNSDADEFENSSDEVLRKDCSKKKDLNSAIVTQSGLKPRLHGSDFEVEKQRFDISDAKFGRDYVGRFRFDASDGGFGKATERRSRFECRTCNKTFHSYQALGGHRASHKRMMKGCCGSENSLETDASIEQAAVEEMVNQGVGTEAANGSLKKAKRHECLLCGKIFASGQALGGHKRSHLVANSDDRGDASSHQPMVIQQQPLEMPDLLDLNLPASIDGESNNTNVNAELKSWWTASNLKHEPLVSVISN